jgi:Mn2+/Fe2+ NRAMP family transporter
VFSTGVFLFVGNPIKILLTVGALNGLILPIALAVMLLVAKKVTLVGAYKHPKVLLVAGWMVVIIMSWMGFNTIQHWFIN